MTDPISILKKLPFLKGNSASGDLVRELPNAGFLPYACHFDDYTLLTKNGELLQVIKITGFSSESVGSEDADLRAMIRQAIRENINTDDYAIWFHTIRRKRSLKPGGQYPENFTRYLNESWDERNQWDSAYVNEVYMTVIRDGEGAELKDVKGLLKSFSLKTIERRHLEALDNAAQEIHFVVDGMLSTLGTFGASRLGVVDDDNVYHSEILAFFSKLLNLVETKVPMPLNDCANYLPTHQVAFGFNSLEVFGDTGKHFGAIFTIKEYHEMIGESLDLFLQLPQEFIITQTLDFINRGKALQQFKEQGYIFDVSGDEELKNISGINDIIRSDDGRLTDFGQGQLTIFLLSHDIEGLNRDIQNAEKSLGNLGVVVTRRDLRLEECYWAQFPANFSYLTRLRAINTSRVGGFASLYNFPAGKRMGSHWGDAVTVFRTQKGTPFFFNFHVEDNGHTAILGPKGSGKTVLLNFLVAESQKFGCRLFFFDQMRASKVFISAIDGYYTIIRPDKPSKRYAFNPLLIDDNEANRAFLKEWLIHLASTLGEKIRDPEIVKLEEALEFAYSLPPEKRRLSALSRFFEGTLGNKMAPWIGSGQYAHLFDNERQSIVSLDEDIYGFGMSYLIKDQKTLIPVLTYLMHRIEMSLDGRPTMIVLDEAWKLVNNSVFAPKLSGWLERMKQKNVVVIFATESIANASKSEITSTITNQIATRILLPNPDAEMFTRAYKEVWGLSNQEFDNLLYMRADKRQFMLKQNDKAIVASLDLGKMPELDILSGSDDTVAHMIAAMKEVGTEIEKWVPKFYELCEENRKPTLDSM